MYIDETWDGTPENASYICNKFALFNITATFQAKWTSALTKNAERGRFEDVPRIVVSTFHGATAIFPGQRVFLDIDGTLVVLGKIKLPEVPDGGA